MINTIISSLNAGELSPRLWSRVDLDKYGSGCRRLENFISLPAGGINRRPGTAFINEVKDSTKSVRLIGFNFSTTTNFVLEFGDLYVRFYSNGAQVKVSSTPYEIVSPYAQADLFAIQYCQINDVMYLAHANYPVYKLSRVADTNWTLAAVSWDYPAFRDENITTTTITPSAITGTGIILTASTPIFDPGDVGGYYRIGTERTSTTSKIAITANGQSTAISVLGTWEFTTTGLWTATVDVQASYDGGTTWDTVRSFTGAKDRNITTTGVQQKEALMRINISGWTAGTAPTFAYLDAVEATVYGVVKITAYTSGTLVTGTVVKDILSTSATPYWAEGEWSPRRGFPRTVALHQQRLFFGGSKSHAVTIWGSTVGDFENFLVTTFDDSGLNFTLSTVEQNQINWLLSYKQNLLIGTTGDEFMLKPSSSGSAITPTNLDITRQSRYGSAYLPAILVNNAPIYLQRHGRKFQEMFYNWQIDGFVSNDLTLLSDHVTAGGIVQFAFQQQLDPIFWCVTANGILSGMTYDRTQNVVSWHRHTTQGTFESVATIYGNGTGDEIWVVVNRTINGATKRYIERFDPSYRDSLDNEDSLNWFYVDAYKAPTPNAATATFQFANWDDTIPVGNLLTITDALGNIGYFALDPSTTGWDGTKYKIAFDFTGDAMAGDFLTAVNAYAGASGTPFRITATATGPTTIVLTQTDGGSSGNVPISGWGNVAIQYTGFSGGGVSFSGLSHLEGQTVSILADGAVHPDLTVTSGTITLQNPAAVVTVGLPYFSYLLPTSFDPGPIQGGSAQGRHYKVHRAGVRFYNSLGGEFQTSPNQYDPIPFRDVDSVMDHAPATFTGEIELTVCGDYGRTADLIIRQGQPLPMSIMALLIKWDISGD